MNCTDKARLKDILGKIKHEAQYLGDEDIIENAKEGLKILNGKSPLHTDTINLTLCRYCWCMTKTFNGRCGKCGTEKDGQWEKKL
ncbi:hypothetical protein IJI55_00915 [Candidatus Saccharibacteria bacterium]|nr:hypothetical protein [Candidatus Saccharibacteria bacterium]